MQMPGNEPTSSDDKSGQFTDPSSQWPIPATNVSVP
jgi:hypothetical protein